MAEPNTIAAIATAPGQGGIAVVRLSGPGSHAVAKAVFIPKNKNKIQKSIPGYTALYGRFMDASTVIDDGIALFFCAPHSYTGEDAAELFCHGGEQVSAALLAACVRAGAAPAAPGEFTRRAFVNGRMSLTQAEAVVELVGAVTRQGAAAARVALDGVLQRRIDEIKAELVALAGHLAAWVDYPEEDVPALSAENFNRTITEAKDRLQTLIQDYDRGLVLRRGVPAAIVGSPNVGKSTLFNLLSGFERSIVTPVAGTTRDVVREQVNVGGAVLLLSDTAGLHQSNDVVEREGIRRSGQELENAALIIAVFDGSQPFGDGEQELARRCKGRLALGVINKSDLQMRLEIDALKPYFDTIAQVSALDENTPKILQKEILKLLQISNMDPGAPMLQNQRQLAAAVAARNALNEATQAMTAGLGLDAAGVCLDEALASLACLSGENASEAVIEEVFSRFCVGK